MTYDRPSYARAIGRRIRTRRQQRGWSLAEAALRCGLAETRLVELEAGSVDVTLHIDEASRLVQALGDAILWPTYQQLLAAADEIARERGERDDTSGAGSDRG